MHRLTIARIAVQTRTAQLAEADARLIQALERETAAENRYLPGQRALNALQDHLVGQSISVASGSYTIRGPSYQFVSRDEAAVDAIAMSWAVVAATGRNIEYSGYVYEDSPGVFTYNQTLNIGRAGARATLNIALVVGRASGAVPLQLNPRRNEVGLFHIHPRNGSNDALVNAYFGPGDLYVSQTRSSQEFHNLASYLGGSDGSVRAIMEPLSLPSAPPYNPSVPSSSTLPLVTDYQVVQQPGYFVLK